MRYIISLVILAGIFAGNFAQTPDFTGIKIAIDPGHGGHESDDRGQPNGFWESEGNLTKGLWLRDLLEGRGAEVFMTRTNNLGDDANDIGLSERAAVANANEVDLFISIHSNAGSQSSNYPMTIFNGTTESPSIPQAKEWAIVLWEQLITNVSTYWTNTDPKWIGDLTLNPTWLYGYGVLYPLTVPGIISEGSFHDYKPEQDRLLNLEYRKQEAWNMLYAMEEYFSLSGTEPDGNISGIIRDSLLVKDYYSVEGSPDGYMVVNGSEVKLVETGETYIVDNVNTGFYYFDSLAPGMYHLVFSATDYFNDTVELEVAAHKFSYHNHWLRADKTMPPRIISYGPSEGELTPCFDPVNLTFNMNMDSASFAEAFSITPEIDGKFNWDKKYLNVSFQPDIPYDTSTMYTVFIDTIAEHQWGVRLDTTLEFSFNTENRNRYYLESSFPADEQSEIDPFLQFRLIFDNTIDNTSLIDAVSILSDGGEPISTRGASIQSIDGKGHYYFQPSEDLEYGKEYVLQLLGSIMDAEYIPLVDTVKIKFTTRPELDELIVLDEFDDAKNWSIDFTGSTGTDPASFVYKWTKTYRSGAASMLTRYTFLGDGAECLVKPDNPILLNEGSLEAGLWIWGEMSKNLVILGFDTGLEQEVGSVDFAGWRYCSAEVPEGATEIQYVKIKLSAEGVLTEDIIFDGLSQPVISSTNTRKFTSNLKVFPNPLTGPEIQISGLPSGETAYRIFDLDGRQIQQGLIEKGDQSIMLTEASLSLHMFVLQLGGRNENKSFLIIKSTK